MTPTCQEIAGFPLCHVSFVSRNTSNLAARIIRKVEAHLKALVSLFEIWLLARRSFKARCTPERTDASSMQLRPESINSAKVRATADATASCQLAPYT